MKTMSSSFLKSRRTLGLVGLLLVSQWLTACVVVPVPSPRPHYRPGVVVEVGPDYRLPPPRGYYDRERYRGR